VPAVDPERPPLLGTWGRVYWAIIVYLIVTIVALAAFARAFHI